MAANGLSFCSMLVALSVASFASTGHAQESGPPPGLTPPPAAPENANPGAQAADDGNAVLNSQSNVKGYGSGDASDIISTTGTVFTMPAPTTGGPVPNVYNVVRGDTMWDICARFWGDPYFWPSLWSYNPSVGNAHFIYPGDQLRFTQGSPVRPPGMAVGDEEPVAVNTPVMVEQPMTSQYVESALSNAIECGAPLSFNAEPAGAKISSIQRGFLSREKKTPVGQIIRSPEMGENLGEGDLVYLEFSQLSEVSCGDVYTVYRPTKRKVKYPGSRFKKIGDLFEISAEVRVLDLNDHVATAEILRAYYEVRRGDLLSDFIPVRHQVNLRSSTKDIDGNIIVALNAGDRSLSERDVVFIDRGEDDGLAEGDAFYIVRQGDGRYDLTRSDVDLPDNVIGQLVIIEPFEDYSSAMILKSTDVIRVGDRVSMTLY